MKYRKGDVLLARVVVDYDSDETDTSLMVTPASDKYNSRAIKYADIAGVERLKFDPGESAVYDNEPCTVRFVDVETNKAWITAFNNDLVVHVSELSRPPVADEVKAINPLRDRAASAELV